MTIITTKTEHSTPSKKKTKRLSILWRKQCNACTRTLRALMFVLGVRDYMVLAFEKIFNFFHRLSRRNIILCTKIVDTTCTNNISQKKDKKLLLYLFNNHNKPHQLL